MQFPMLDRVHVHPPPAGHCPILPSICPFHIIERLQAGRAPVVSSKQTLPPLSWYSSPPFSEQRRVVVSRGEMCMCVCQCVCLCLWFACACVLLLAQYTGRDIVLIDIVLLLFVSKMFFVIEDAKAVPTHPATFRYTLHLGSSVTSKKA